MAYLGSFMRYFFKDWVTLTLTLQGHKVKCDGAIELFIYDLLLIFNNNNMSISHDLAVIATRIFSPIASARSDTKLK